ncbi:MAG: NGG1p interacting factor NIF3 [Actinomycetia bacterium]|nr:NGG1p interacting factor NIF3 [Actinomycetes bacterium]
MKLIEIYRLAVEMGIKNDPRGLSGVREALKDEKKRFKKLSKKEKPFYDNERLENPYSDTRILYGKEGLEIKGVMAGIDLEVGEVLLADRLKEKGEQIDLLIAHHPEGKALASLSDVMSLQADVWHKFGVPINIGDVLIDGRMKEVYRAILPVNHNRAVDAARLLKLPFMTVHTPADNLVNDFLQKDFDKKKPRTVGDIVERLKEIPEYKSATKGNAGPTVLVGDSSKRAGKVMVDMTGGTEGPQGVIEKLANAGVGTIIGMHMGEKLRKKADKFHVNVIIAGHIASDNLGFNLFLDELEKKKIRIYCSSGLNRVKRI